MPRNTTTALPYDQKDAESIEEYAKRLVGKTLRQAVTDAPLAAFKPSDELGKGGFGILLEVYYFHLKANNESIPDFPEAGLELKSVPLKSTAKGLAVKERLVFGVINYNEVVNEPWDNCGFLRKNNRILLIGYQFDKTKLPMDFHVELVRKLIILELPAEDVKIIREDWEKIIGKIRQGKAHEISGGDTFYLEACTKGATSASVRSQPFSDIPAKQRAFAFKQSYIDALLRKDIEDAENIIKSDEEISAERTFEELVIDRFKPHYGKSFEEISQAVGFTSAPDAKSRFADLTRAVLGVRKKKIEEFEKAGVTARTIRLNTKNMPEEDVSFPAFKYKEIVEESSWDESTLKEMMEKRFFFVIYKEDMKGRLILKKVMFWNVPEAKLDSDIRRVWEETVKRIKEGRADDLPKISENAVAHVRPHGRDAEDVDETPQGQKVIKKCFWLNRGFLREELAYDIQ